MYRKVVVVFTVLLVLLTVGVIGNSVTAKPHKANQGCSSVETAEEYNPCDDTGDGNATPEDLSTPSDTDQEEPLTPEEGETQNYCAGWAADNVTLGPIQSANEERIRTMFEACMQANGINSPDYEYQAPTYDNPTG